MTRLAQERKATVEARELASRKLTLLRSVATAQMKVTRNSSVKTDSTSVSKKDGIRSTKK